MDECGWDWARKLRLTDHESLGINVSSTSIKKEVQEFFRCLVGKILSPRLYGDDVVYEMTKLTFKLTFNPLYLTPLM